jgi:hypothetical protein
VAEGSRLDNVSNDPENISSKDLVIQYCCGQWDLISTT